MVNARHGRRHARVTLCIMPERHSGLTDPRPPVFVSTMASDRFEVFHSFVHVEDGLRLHTHDHYEINCILEGTGEFQIDGEPVRSEPGSVFMINPGVVHNVIRQTSERYERVYLHVNAAFLRSLSTTRTDLESCFHTPSGTPINRVLTMNPSQLRELMQPLLRPPSTCFGDDLRYNEHFVAAMIRLNELVLADQGAAITLPEPESCYAPAVAAALRYIDEHLAEELSLDVIADSCATNKYHLSRTFKKELGLTIGRFVQRRRLQRSKRLLAQIGSPKRIYRQCGFKSYTHFLRCFQQEFGMTTSAYIEWSHQPHDRS